ncbi:MAG: hypothetical protein UE866_06305 [Clostridia bacterium]|jgi:hypothetical protein|nr:hypothetical protein [Clostridia bacterium]
MKRFILFLLLCCMLFSGCRNNKSTNNTKEIASIDNTQNLSEEISYITYKGFAIALNKNNNTASLIRQRDLNTNVKVLNYSYEDICKLVDQLSIEKIHISGPNNVKYGLYYRSENNSDSNSKNNALDYDLMNVDLSIDTFKVLLNLNIPENDKMTPKVMENLLTALVNEINSRDICPISTIEPST